MSELRRIFTALCVLGVPGSGKTSLIASYARYVWERHRKVTLLYSWDGGAIPTDVQKLMKRGILRFFRAHTRSAEGLSIETMVLATKGYWPAKIDPETGEVSPAVRMVAPVTTVYTASCRKTGEKLGTLPNVAVITPLYCTPCKTVHAVGELNVIEQVSRTVGFEQVGAVAYDGLTSMGNVVLDHMDEARGAGQIGGEKSAFGGTVVSGSVKFGGGNRADIGFGQSRCRQFVKNTLSIPHLVESPVFTALSMEATDEGGLPIVGLKLPGRAATDEASAWFGNVFEMGKTRDEQGLEHFTLFLRPFTDPQNRRHLLKTSGSPTGFPADKLIDPIGQPWTQANLGLVLRMLDDDLRQKMAEDDVADAPGIAGTPSDYGEPFQMTSASVPPAGASADLSTLTAPTSAAASYPAAPSGSAPPAVVARRRPAAVAAQAATAVAVADPPAVQIPTPTTPTPTPMTSTPTTTTAQATPAAPPPPPGMKPPARAPGV